LGVSIWLDVVGLVTAVTFLEAAFTGKGRTISRGHASFWQVAPWLRPVLGIVGLGLLSLVLVNFLRRF
jgi:hypothetical protein